MTLLIVNRTKEKINQRELERIILKAQNFLRFGAIIDELSLGILGLKEMRKVNYIYRGQDEPTDVLSFDYGEILLCPAYIKKKYHLNKKSIQEKIRELFVHGLAHLGGFNHRSKKAQLKMRRLEQKILTC